MEHDLPIYYGAESKHEWMPAVDVAKLRGVWLRRIEDGIEIILPDSVRSWILSTHFAEVTSVPFTPFKAFGKCFLVDLTECSYADSLSLQYVPKLEV